MPLHADQSNYRTRLPRNESPISGFRPYIPGNPKCIGISVYASSGRFYCPLENTEIDPTARMIRLNDAKQRETRNCREYYLGPFRPFIILLDHLSNRSTPIQEEYQVPEWAEKSAAEVDQELIRQRELEAAQKKVTLPRPSAPTENSARTSWEIRRLKNHKWYLRVQIAAALLTAFLLTLALSTHSRFFLPYVIAGTIGIFLATAISDLLERRWIKRNPAPK